jgi:outer membrane protein assembly factor BamB
MPSVTKPSAPRAVDAPPLRRVVATRVALAAGAFCLVMALSLAVERFHYRTTLHPLEHPRMIALKEQLVRDPTSEALKKQIRGVDLELRRAHDRYLARVRLGQWLLLGGMAVFLGGIQTATWRGKIARPGKLQRPAGWQAREVLRASVAVGGLAAMTGCLGWWLVQSGSTLLTPQVSQAAPVESSSPEKPATASVATTTIAGYPSAEEVNRNWGRFRGPQGGGVTTATNLPLAWNVQTGEGVVWKTKAPGPDFNSPVVWGNRLFLTSATAKKREVFCYDTESGQLVWQKAVENIANGGAAVEMSEVSGGYACSTAATDGRRVYAMFANGDLAAFDFTGNLAWGRSFAPIVNQYGHAASLELWQDRVIVQLDHGESDQKVSRIIAVNTGDGKTVWEKPRATHGTWSTPLVIEAAGQAQIITLGLPHVIAYSATNGTELWQVEGIDGEVTPSPIYAGGLVLAPSPSSKLMAIKPDGAGDVTKTHVAWVAEDGVPDITSPVSDGRFVYLVTTGGTVTCCDLKSGKKAWEKDLELEFKASPSLAGDRLYLASTKGPVIILAAGAEFKELARAEMGDEVVASPASADGRLFVRTKQNLYCLGSKPK